MTAFIAALIPIALWIAGVVGWVWNIVKIVQALGPETHVTTMFIARCVGTLVAPLGAVLGYL